MISNHYHSNEKLHVLVTLFNPSGFKRRVQLHNEFCERMRKEPNVELYICEISPDGHPFVGSAEEDPKHIQINSSDVLWCKERAVNMLIHRLPKDWKYAAMIDADVTFVNHNWVADTIYRLNQYKIVQMFSQCCDLDIDSEGTNLRRGFMCEYQRNPTAPMLANEYTGNLDCQQAHVGYAWAFTREAVDVMGGYYDKSIIGNGDWISLCAWLGRAREGLPPEHDYKLHPQYVQSVMDYQANCAGLYQSVGYVDGLIIHHFHGNKAKRKYYSRNEILEKNEFNPYTDLVEDSNGMYKLSKGAKNYIGLRNDIINYFAQRDEDATS